MVAFVQAGLPERSVNVCAGSYEGHPDAAVTDALKTLIPPFETLRNVDYNKPQAGKPTPGQVLRDIPNGGVAAVDITDCASKCIQTPPCNMASWYGEELNWSDSRNCWLKELEQPCQYPADLEAHPDNSYLLLARPTESCAPRLRELTLTKHATQATIV